MKFKSLVCGLVAAAFTLTTAAFAQPTNQGRWSASTTALSSTGTSTTVGTAYDVSGGTACAVHVISTSTSSANVDIEGSIDGSTYWYLLARVANPTTVGEIQAGPCPRFIRINPSTHASGTLKAYLTWRNMPADPIGSSWKLVSASANTFGALSVSNLTDSGLTITRVPFASTGGLLVDSSAFTYASGVLSSTVHKGVTQSTIGVQAVDGAAAVLAGTVLATKAGVLAVTLVAPTVTTHDGVILRFIATTANANTITTSAAAFNGNKNIATMGGAIGDQCAFIAYQGVWYQLTGTNCTLSGS